MTVKRFSQNKGFTLIEILTAMAILGIIIGFLYNVFFLNWESFDQLTAQADMSQEVNQIVEPLSKDVHNSDSSQNTSTSNTDIQQVNLRDSAGNLLGTYFVNSNGEFHIDRDDVSGNLKDIIIGKNLDFNNSKLFIDPATDAINITLSMKQQIFGVPVALTTSSIVNPRNSNET